jgi:hypothetical protein
VAVVAPIGGSMQRSIYQYLTIGLRVGIDFVKMLGSKRRKQWRLSWIFALSAAVGAWRPAPKCTSVPKNKRRGIPDLSPLCIALRDRRL